MVTFPLNSSLLKSSFRLPLLWLRAPERRAMYALYHFCRTADDAVDETPDADAARRELTRLHNEIEQIYAGLLHNDLAMAIHRYGMQREYFDALLAGMEMDAEDQMVAPDFETLTLYCYRAAGCVGLLSLAIFGEERDEARKFAVALGHAMQLTNILRDIREDAGRGRLYLPREELDAAPIDFTSARSALASPQALLPVCQKLAAIAQHYFNDADALGRKCSRWRLLPALLMGDIYQEYLRILQRNGFFAPFPKLSGVQKIRLLAKRLLRNLRA